MSTLGRVLAQTHSCPYPSLVEHGIASAWRAGPCGRRAVSSTQRSTTQMESLRQLPPKPHKTKGRTVNQRMVHTITHRRDTYIDVSLCAARRASNNKRHTSTIDTLS
jgi:hypothetical protein